MQLCHLVYVMQRVGVQHVIHNYFHFIGSFESSQCSSSLSKALQISACQLPSSCLLVSSKSRLPVMKNLVGEMEWNQLHTNSIPNPTYSVRYFRFTGPFVLQAGFKCNGHQTGKKWTVIRKIVPIVGVAGLCMSSQLAWSGSCCHCDKAVVYQAIQSITQSTGYSMHYLYIFLSFLPNPFQHHDNTEGFN